MATIGTLAVALTAKADQFLSGLSKAEDAVKKFAGSIPGLNALLSKTTAIVGAIAGGAFVAYAKSTADAIDHTAKLADRLGVTTEGLVGLQHAAELAGGGQEQLDAALGKLSKGLGQAAEDSGSAEKGLAAIGLTLEDVTGKDSIAQFSLIADGVSHLATQEQKAAVASDLFGKSGGELVNILDLGSKGLSAMAADAEKLGITFSRVDAAKVEQANDALHQVGDFIHGQLQKVVIELAPYIEGLSKAFVDWATEGEGAAPKIVDAVEWVAAAIAKVAGVMQFLYGTGKMLVGSVGQAFVEIEGAIGEVVSTLAELVRWIPGLDGKFQWVDDWSKSQEERHKAMGDMTADGERLINTSDELSTKTTAWFDKMKAGANAAAAETRDLVAARRAASAEAGPGAFVAAQAAAAEAKEAEKTAKSIEQQRIQTEKRVVEMERVAQLSVEEQKYSSEILKIEEARAAGFEDLANRMQDLLDMQQASDTADRDSKEAQAEQDKVDSLTEEISKRERIADLSTKDRAFSNEILEIEHARIEGWTTLAGRLEVLLAKKREELKLSEAQQKIDDARRQAAEDEARKAMAAAELAKSLQKELALLQASSDVDRERIRIQQELADNVEKAGKNQAALNAAQQVAAEKLKKTSEDAAKASDKATGGGGGGSGGAAADLSSNQDGSHMAGGHRKQKSAKSFTNFGGGVNVLPESVFQPGQTREMYNEEKKNRDWVAVLDRKAAWEAAHPEARAAAAAAAPTIPAATTATGASTAATGGGAGAMPDASPGLQAAAEAMKTATENLQKIVDGVNELGTQVEALAAAAGEGAKSTQDAVKRVDDKATSAIQKVDQMKAALDKITASISGA